MGPQLGRRKRTLVITGPRESWVRYRSDGLAVSWFSGVTVSAGDACEGDFEAEVAELAYTSIHRTNRALARRGNAEVPLNWDDWSQ
jgi:hypothetical protein